MTKIVKRNRIYKKRKTRNKLARELAERKFRPRIVHPLKIYNRNKQEKIDYED